MYCAKAICFADLLSLRKDHEKKCTLNVLLFCMLKKTTQYFLFLCEKTLWVGIKGQTRKGDAVVGVCYRPLEEEEEEGDGAGSCLKVTGNGSCGGFIYPGLCWRSYTVQRITKSLEGSWKALMTTSCAR